MDSPRIALLGRKEKPTDGVEDYCMFLAEALSRRCVVMKTVRMDWSELGWVSAVRMLKAQTADWRGSWVVIHYTAMAWSRRGFPLGVLAVLAILRRRGVRCAVLFHEATRQLSGSRLIDKLRGTFQEWVIRRCFHSAERAVFTVPLETVAWLPRDQTKATYIPIGANIPERISPCDPSGVNPSVTKTIAVFCLSLGPNRRTEIAELAHAAGRAREATGHVRFVILGKGSDEARTEIEEALRKKAVEVSVVGRLPAEEVADTLAAADVLLYLGAYVTQTRGSALAAVACGLPIVGYSGATREPIYDAGVELVPRGDREALARALVRVLNDDALRSELRRRSCEAQRLHFSWDIIADGFVRTLRSERARA